MTEKKPKSPEQKQTQISQKIFNHEVQKIRNLNMTDIMRKKRQPTEIQVPNNSQLNLTRNLNEKFGVKHEYYGQKTPGEMWTMHILQRQRLRKINNKEVNKNLIWNFTKRGKLGIDLYLIAFAVFGSLMVPFYFYKKFQIQRKRITQNRGIAPQMIQYIDENSAINIDSVSLQSVHYLNPERAQKIRNQMQNIQEFERLEKQIKQM